MLRTDGTETQALLALRNWVLVPMTSLCWLSHLLLAAQAVPRISPIEVACLVAASVPFCLALIFVRRPGVLWLSLAGLGLLLLPALVGSGTGVWLYPRFIIGQAGYILITMLPRRWGVVAAFSTPVALRLLWALGPTNIAPDGFTIAYGMLPVLQLLGSNLLIWWVWHRLLRRSARLDAQVEGLRAAEMQALADRERSATWRTSTRRVHESVLNCINALLAVRSISPESASQWSAKARASVDPGDEPQTPVTALPGQPAKGLFDGAQALVSAGMAGTLFAGSWYVFFIQNTTQWREILGPTLMLVGSAIAIAIVIRNLRVGPVAATAYALIPSAVPWVLAPAAADCGQIATVASALTIAGYAISTIALCGGLVPYLVALPIWGAGAFLLASYAPAACQRSPVVMMFNTLSIIPLVLIAAYIGIRAHRASMVRMDQARARAALAIGRARALRQVNQQLTTSVLRSADLLTEVGERGGLEPATERELACQSALLRAGIAVDRERDGAFTLAAFGLVQVLAGGGVPIRVVVLSGSQDRRPLPSGLVDSLGDAVLVHRERLSVGDVSISCIHGQASDVIAITLPWSLAQGWLQRHGPMTPGARATGLGDGEESGLSIAVHPTEQEASDGSPMGLVTIERAVQDQSRMVDDELVFSP